jgi:phytanoyl-CoA hydroxylase
MTGDRAIDIRRLKTSFDQDGYVFIPGLLGKKEVDGINAKLAAFIESGLPGMTADHIFYEEKNDPSTLKQLQDLHRCDPFFARILNGSEFERIAAALLDEDVQGKNLEYFNKPPRVGKPTPPHQDNYYFMLRPPKAVTMWMALEEVDEENGCVRYIRGSHLKGMRPHGRTETLGFSQGIVDYGQKEKPTDEVFFPTKPGDLLIHHSMTIHRADANQSVNRSRKALGFIYFGVSAVEDLEAKRAYQKKLQAERDATN